MAISKVMRAALRMLSYPDIQVKKNYKFDRKVVNAAHYHYLRPFFKTWDHQISGGDHEIPVRIYSPMEPGNYPILLFFHGGGWVLGSINSYNKVCANMAEQTKHMVVSVDYRLAPEYPFPAAVNDCYLAMQDVFRHASLLGARQEDITVIGDSAGGNLAAVVSLMARDRGGIMPKRQILIYPATYNDHTVLSPFESVRENGTDYLLTSKRVRDYMELYISRPEDRYNPYFAPLLAEDLTNQPRTLIVTAEFDPLRDEGECYGKRLRESGNDVEIHRITDALHGFITLPSRFPQIGECYGRINRFINEVPKT